MPITSVDKVLIYVLGKRKQTMMLLGIAKRRPK